MGISEFSCLVGDLLPCMEPAIKVALITDGKEKQKIYNAENI